MITGLGRLHKKRLCSSKKHYFRAKLGMYLVPLQRSYVLGFDVPYLQMPEEEGKDKPNADAHYPSHQHNPALK